MASMNVGELAFYLTLDDTQYQRGMTNAGKAAQGLQKTASNAGRVLAGALTAHAASMGALTAGLMKAGGAYNILQQNSRAALITLLGSQKAVNEQMSKLNELAARSPFSKSIFISAQQQLLAFGMQAEKVIPTLDAIQNAVAATGGSSQQLAEITYVLAQIQAAGKITATDLMQLGQRGIDAATLIGSQMGKTGAQIRQDITNGALSASDAIDALTAGMSAKFGGATDRIKQQWTGAVDRIKAAWRDTGSIIAEPFIDPNGGGQAVVWANRVADVMRQVQKHVQTGMTAVEDRMGPAFNTVTSLIEKAAAATARFNMHGFLRQIDQLSRYKPLIAGVSGALLTMGTANIPVISALTGRLNPLLVGLASLAATSPQLREVGAAFITALAPAAPILQQATTKVADLAMNLITALAPGLKNVAAGAGNFLADLSPLVPALVDAADAALPLIAAVADLAGDIANLPTPLLAAAAAVTLLHSPVMKLGSGLVNVAGNVAQFVAATRQVAAETGAAVAMTGMKAAASGLGNALAGLVSPAGLVGIGLTALTAIVAAFAAKKAEAARDVREFVSTLDQETGAITENTRALAAKKLEEKGALEALETLGISTEEAVSALVNQGAAYEDLKEKVAEARQGLADYVDVNGDLTLEGLNAEQAVLTLEEALPGLSDALDGAREESERTARAMGDSTAAADRYRQAIDALTDAQQKQAAANGDLIAAQYQTQDATTALSEAISAQTEVVRDGNGAIDTASAANRGFIEATMDKIDAINQEVEAFAQTGATQDQVNERQRALTAGLYDQLAALGITGTEAQAFAEKLGLIPEHKAVSVDLTTSGAEADLDAFIEEIRSNHNGILTINANDDPAVAEFLATIGMVESSPGVFQLDADNNPALAKLAVSLATVNKSTGVATIDGNNTKFLDAAKQAKATADQMKSTITINGVEYAVATAQSAVARINQMRATISIYGSRVAGISGTGGLTQKDGGVVSYFASGGFSENHVAQIAPAGSWRVWGEPETGGEGYVPLALSKRKRSQEIMAEIARRFGDLYIPSGRAFANGGTTVGGSTSSTVVNFGGVTIDASSLEAIATVNDFLRRLGYSTLMNGVER